jgi:hypothetical protein
VFGGARLSGEAGADTMKALRSPSDGHTVDALVAITAQYEDCALLTQETKRLPNRARAQGIEVLNCEELFTEIGFDGNGSVSA